MKNKNNILKISFLVVTVVMACVVFLFLKSQNQVTRRNEVSSVVLGGVTLKVDVADTRDEQALGLSGRNKLESGEGMLFVFDSVGKYDFWMKDMNFPIDILWIDADMHVLYIKKNAEIRSYPSMFGPASSNTKYVLETVAGFSEHNKVKVGDIVKFEY